MEDLRESLFQRYVLSAIFQLLFVKYVCYFGGVDFGLDPNGVQRPISRSGMTPVHFHGDMCLGWNHK